MELLLLGVVAVACPIGMGLMMWMMNRGGHKHQSSDTDVEEQIARLRAKVNQLEAQRAGRAVEKR